MDRHSDYRKDIDELKESLDQAYQLNSTEFKSGIRVITKKKLDKLSENLSDSFLSRLEEDDLIDLFFQQSTFYQNEMLSSFHSSLEGVLESLEDSIEREKESLIETLEAKNLCNDTVLDELEDSFKGIFDFVYQQTRRNNSFQPALRCDSGIKKEEFKSSGSVFSFESYRQAILILNDLEQKVLQKISRIKAKFTSN